MLWNREGFEKSCYRLKTKTGEFIYMKTHGYLEPGEDVQRSTLVCVNTLVSDEEGEREIQNMKKRFSPLIKDKAEPAILAIAEKDASTVRRYFRYMAVTRTCTMYIGRAWKSWYC